VKRPQFVRPLSIEGIEAIARSFKDDLQREANRFVRRHNSQAALAALEGVEYINNFVSTLKLRAGSQAGIPARARPISFGVLDDARTKAARDAEWSRLVLGITDKVLTPAQGAKWLKRDRAERARHVSEARARRGPVWS